MKKIIKGVLIVFLSISLQSQHPKKTTGKPARQDTARIKQTAVMQIDSVRIMKQKLDSGNVDIRNTVDRAYKKLSMIPPLVNQVALGARHDERPAFDVSLIEPILLPVNLPGVDTVIQEKPSNGKFLWIFPKRR